MAEAVDIRDAAACVQAAREPLATALRAAAANLTVQGIPQDQAATWARAELLAVVASVLAADLPTAADGDPLDEASPFDESDTLRQIKMERDLRETAERLRDGAGETLAMALAGALAVQSIAGILAGIAEQPPPERVTALASSA